jgi:hypothetical protein
MIFSLYINFYFDLLQNCMKGVILHLKVILKSYSMMTVTSHGTFKTCHLKIAGVMDYFS